MKILISSFFLALIAITANATDYVQQYVVPQRTVEMDARYALGLDGYFSAQQMVNNQKMEQRVEGVESQLQQLIELVGEINSKLEGDDNANGGEDNGNPGDGDGNNDDVPDEDETPETPPDNDGDNGDVTDLDIAAYNIFASKCNSCHGSEDSKGDLRLVDKDNEALFYQDLASRVKIFWRTNGVGLGDVQRMPPGEPLSDEDVTTLLQWMVELTEN